MKLVSIIFRLACLLPVALVVFGAGEKARAFELSLPVDCQLGETCFIQNYVDMDKGDGVRDFRCLARSYDGHKGTDIRLIDVPAMGKGVSVLAAADGKVVLLRDGVPNRDISKPIEGEDFGDRECGNGLVIVHGGGWQTLYCHLRRGSFRVRKGMKVKRGQKLAQIGLSGMTAFPHLHFGVRHVSRDMDPFSGRASARAKALCKPEATAGGLWRDERVAEAAMRAGKLLRMGFAAGPVDHRRLLIQGRPQAPKSRRAKALAVYASAINLQKGDRLQGRLIGPAGLLHRAGSKPMPRNKASYTFYFGRKRRGEAWPAGRYRGEVSLVRDGRIVWTHKRLLDLR